MLGGLFRRSIVLRYSRFISKAISNVVDIVGLGGANCSGLRILMYHAVGSAAHGDSRGLYSISPEMFKSQMIFLNDNYPESLIRLPDKTPRHDRFDIGVSFDDGYRDNLEVAAPILHDLNIPFSVFISSDFIRNNKKGFLSSSEIRQLADYTGASIGAHGATHVDLTQCGRKQLDYELGSSKCYLEDITGYEVQMLSYPYGRVNSTVKQAALKFGYTAGLSSYPVINKPGCDPMLLGRTEIHYDDEINIFSQKLKGCWDWKRFVY